MTELKDLFGGSRRILIVQLSAIGDVLHAGSIVPALKRRYPGVRVGMLVYSDYAEVLAGIPGLDHRHVFHQAELKKELDLARTDEESLKAVYRREYLLIEELQMRNYDLAVNFHNSVVSAYLSTLSGAKNLLGMRLEANADFDIYDPLSRALYDDLRSTDRRTRSKEHVAVRYHQICGLPVDDIRLNFQLPPSVRNPLTDENFRDIGPNGRAYAIHVGAGRREKCWLSSRWRELIRRLNKELGWIPVLVGTEVERDRNFSDVMTGLEIPFIDLCGRSLVETGRALASCRLFVGADSGPMHLASALDVPVVALFGPTVAAESYPLCGRNAVIQRRTMAEIDVNEVYESIRTVCRIQPADMPAWKNASENSGRILYENPSPRETIQQNVA